MIDITVDKISREIRIEHTAFSFGGNVDDFSKNLCKAIELIIHKAQYSGESITLWEVVNEKEKKLIHEF